MNRLLKFLPALALAAALAAPAPSLATTAAANLSVSTAVAQNCTIGTSALAFTNYDPIVANATSADQNNTTLALSCTEGAASVYVTASDGSNYQKGSCAARALSATYNSSTVYLCYDLYTDSGYSVEFNGTNSGGHTFTPSFASTTSSTETIYASIPGTQSVPVASYNDAVTLTANF